MRPGRMWGWKVGEGKRDRTGASEGQWEKRSSHTQRYPPMKQRLKGTGRDLWGTGGELGSSLFCLLGPQWVCWGLWLASIPLGTPLGTRALSISPTPFKGLLWSFFFLSLWLFCFVVVSFSFFLIYFSNFIFILFFLSFLLIAFFFFFDKQLVGSWLPGQGSNLSTCAGRAKLKPLD